MDAGLLETVVDSALLGMRSFAKGETLEYPAEYRLAFRELGLSIGLSAVENLEKWSRRIQAYCHGIVPCIVGLKTSWGICRLEKRSRQFWMDGKNREASTWIEHREINMVMLATSLAPGRFLMI